MSREKQIEEIRNIIETDCDFVCNKCEFDGKEHCFIHYCSNALYNAGYRKQEWISVDDRLPETDTRVLVYMHENRMSYTKIDTDRIVARKWVRWGNSVTHWMPLPEAPKMKGGE